MNNWWISDWTKGNYLLFRTCLGLYFIFLLIQFVPCSKGFFSNEGLFSETPLSPFWHFSPSLFFFFHSLESIFIFQSLAIFASIALLVGKASRLSAFYLWFFLASAYTKNPLIINSALSYLGWILLAHTLSPTHPLPSFLRKGLWWILLAGYSISGWHKLESPSWLDGSAIEVLLQSPLSRNSFWVDFLLNYPNLLKFLTWFILVLECFSLPIAFFKSINKSLWICLGLLQMSILISLDCTPIAIGMLLVHMLCADLDWVAKASSKSNKPLLLVDGDCAACSAFSQWLFEEDRSQKWTVSHLGSKTHLLIDPLKERGAIIVWDMNLYKGWQAISHLFCCLGGWWYIVGKSMQWIPKRLSEKIYKGIAYFRHYIPAKSTCHSLPENWKKRILE